MIKKKTLVNRSACQKLELKMGHPISENFINNELKKKAMKFTKTEKEVSKNSQK